MLDMRTMLKESAYVLARLAPPGAAPDDPGILVGCHHDAWVYGASDPTSGRPRSRAGTVVTESSAAPREAPR